MPELPEVETTLQGLLPHIKHQKMVQITVRQFNLRWPIPQNIAKIIKNQEINDATRRGKYLLLATDKGTLILHLGMSGRLKILTQPTPAQKHDHIDITLANQKIIRFTDPRRFGAVLWTTQPIDQHKLIKHLGPEPLNTGFSSHYLFQQAQKRNVPVKSFIMDSKIVVGVGNIYANEALFLAQIHPMTKAGHLTREQHKRLVVAIKKILRAAIKQGGTTLKDFLNSEGKPGYFKFHLKVYGRGGLSCFDCDTILEEIRLGQRSTVFCPACQLKAVPFEN